MRLLIALLVLLLTGGCTGVFMYPDNVRVIDPSAYGLKFSENLLQDEQGPDLIYWDIQAKGKYQGTILFLHGNAGNVSTHLRAVSWLPEEGYRVIMLDYRGYGGSQGDSEIRGVHHDAERMFRFVAAMEPDRSRRILFGQSLGASIALYTQGSQQDEEFFSAIIADSPFASYREITREKVGSFWLLYPFQYPISLLILETYSPINMVKKITVPTLFIHGQDDQIVLPHHSLDLCQAMKGYCTRWEISGMDHIHALNGIGLRKRTIQWIQEVTTAARGKGKH